jgi:FkbM family methyltransferase
MTALHRIRNAVRRLGVDITRYPSGWSGPQLVQLMHQHSIDLVIDVGANEGEYGAMLRQHGYRGRIVSFEPLAGPGRALRRRTQSDPNWTMYPYALGEESGTTTINVSGNRGASSSVLPMLDRHSRAAPHARYVTTETAQLRRLDELWPELAADSARVFLKLDVQGYEAHVLRGAGDYPKTCHGLQIEASFVPLYEGSPLLSDTLLRVQDGLGLTLMATIPGYVDPATGQMLQCDLVLFRADGEDRAGPTGEQADGHGETVGDGGP